jgi:hypothetical protein
MRVDHLEPDDLTTNAVGLLLPQRVGSMKSASSTRRSSRGRPKDVVVVSSMSLP